MSFSIGFGLGICHGEKNGGVVPAPPTGALQIDGFSVIIDTFEVIFS